MKRKILSLILVFAMTVSLLTVGTGAVEPTYGDTAGHWAESSIERWSGHGIIQGSNGLFDPNGQLTCAQLATILAKLLKLPAAKDAGFTDNTADAWYYDAINRCTAAGILNGNGDGTVTPEAPITRERAMVMLARALGIEPIRKPDLTKYTDAAQVSAYAQGYVAALIEAGIVGGVTADELAPQDNINRASTVTILDRAISTYADKAGATVKADGKGLVLVVAENVKITGAPEGTKIVVADGATGLTVNGKSVSDDQTYIVPKTTTSSGSSSGGYSHSHSYVYTDNGDGTHTGRCYANDSTLAPEAHTIVGGKCTVCGAEQTDAVVASVKKSDGTYAYYSTLAEAINAAADGATVTLVKNAEEDITVSGGKALAIDLNGMKLTNKSGDTIVVEIGATLTVTGSGTVDNVTHGKAAIYNNGTVILNGGSYTRSAEASTSIENANGNSYYNILNHGTMTIEENVSVKSSGSFSSLIANGYYSFSDPNPRSGHVSGTNQETPSLTINGGTFSGGINTIKNDDNATLTVNNGSFSNMTQAAIQNNHVATINGGTFDANTYHAIENRHFDGDHNTGSVTVTNGVFTGGLYTTEGAAWNITGGTYSSDPSEYVAEGYIARTNNDGKYVVSMVGTEENPYTLDEFNALTKLPAGRTELYVNIGDVSLADGDVTIGNKNICDMWTWDRDMSHNVGDILEDGRKVYMVRESDTIYSSNKAGITLYISGSVKENPEGGLNQSDSHVITFSIPDASNVVFTKDFTVNGYFRMHTGWSDGRNLGGAVYNRTVKTVLFDRSTFNGIWIQNGGFFADSLTLDGCTFNAYENKVSANDSNPLWFCNIRTCNVTVKNCTFKASRPIKVVEQGVFGANVTITGNKFDMSLTNSDDDASKPKNDAIMFSTLIGETQWNPAGTLGNVVVSGNEVTGANALLTFFNPSQITMANGATFTVSGNMLGTGVKTSVEWKTTTEYMPGFVTVPATPL